VIEIKPNTFYSSIKLLRRHTASGVYPYLQMAQLSHGQFWRKRKKNIRI